MTLAGWYGGTVAEAVSFGLAAAACGFVVDAEAVRWTLPS